MSTLKCFETEAGKTRKPKYTYLQFHAEKVVKEKCKERTKRISDEFGIPSVSKQAVVSTIKPMTQPSSKARVKGPYNKNGVYEQDGKQC